MKCEKVQERVNEYIDRTMPDKDLEEFISHVKSCPDCFDELETYYIVDRAIKYLDDEQEVSVNIAERLQNDLNRQYARVRRKKRLLGVAALLVVVGALSVGLGSFLW